MSNGYLENFVNNIKRKGMFGIRMNNICAFRPENQHNRVMSIHTYYQSRKLGRLYPPISLDLNLYKEAMKVFLYLTKRIANFVMVDKPVPLRIYLFLINQGTAIARVLNLPYYISILIKSYVELDVQIFNGVFLIDWLPINRPFGRFF